MDFLQGGPLVAFGGMALKSVVRKGQVRGE